jgi:hypothetical protein
VSAPFRTWYQDTVRQSRLCALFPALHLALGTGTGEQRSGLVGTLQSDSTQLLASRAELLVCSRASSRAGNHRQYEKACTSILVERVVLVVHV